MSSVILIDCDSIKYSCAAVIQKKDKETEVLNVEPVYHAYHILIQMINGIQEELQSKNIEVYLTKLGDETNFRYKYLAAYKESRKKLEKPVFLNEVHDFILKKYRAVEAVGEEADDLVSIRQYELNPLGFNFTDANSIICSIDKDLDTVPGWHYNYRKKNLYYLTELEAKQNFYLQILTGDKSDDVPRVTKGWRQKPAETAIRNAKSEKELLDLVYSFTKIEIEKQKFTDFVILNACLVKRFIERNGRLLHMRTKKDEIWEIPNL